jgi:hypothetical protein
MMPTHLPNFVKFGVPWRKMWGLSVRPNFYTIWRKFGGREEAMGVVKPNFSPQCRGNLKEGSSGGLSDQISFSTDGRKFSGRKEAATGVGGDGHNRCCHWIISR